MVITAIDSHTTDLSSDHARRMLLNKEKLVGDRSNEGNGRTKKFGSDPGGNETEAEEAGIINSHMPKGFIGYCSNAVPIQIEFNHISNRLRPYEVQRAVSLSELRSQLTFGPISTLVGDHRGTLWCCNLFA